MQTRHWKAFFPGVFFSAFGVAFASGVGFAAEPAGASALRHMPAVAGVLLALAGTWITHRALGRIPLAALLAANLAFGVLLCGVPVLGVPPMGILVAIYLVGFAARLSALDLDLRRWGLFTAALATGAYLAMVVVLGLPLPVWPTFIPS